MQFSEENTLEHRNRRDVYEYVEQRGRVDPEEARRDLGFDETAFGHYVAILKRDGLLAEDDGDLYVEFRDGEAEEFDQGELSFTIRPARQPDISGVVGTMRQVVEEGEYIVAESVADLVDQEQVLFRHGDVESWVFFVATVGDDVVGWVHLDHPEVEKLSHTAELTLGVVEEYRGQGIGGHLLQRGLEWAAARDYEKIYNSVPATNEEAIQFLQDHGWEIEATREDHYWIDDEYVDEVMLAIDL